MNNYEKSKKQAEKYFLSLDQGELLKSCPFAHDESHIFIPFLGQRYRICRKTGRVEKSGDGFLTCKEGNFEECLSIFDFLCHEGEHKKRSGRWAPVDSLKGHPVTMPSLGEFSGGVSQLFDAHPHAFRGACESLGGKKIPMGDIGYEIPVFPNFPVILKFYAADEDFPPQITILWDENTLSFLRYETTFYIAGHLLRLLSQAIRSEDEITISPL